jgi:ABC-2 type transport system ATP-binding protein
MPVVEVNGLVKRFKDFTAVDGISFSVNKGEIFGFLGPNGAGKSTTIKMLSTLLSPTAGTATLAGFDVVRQKSQVRQNIGMVFQDQSLDENLTAMENLQFHAMMYNVPGHVFKERVEQVLRMVDLADRRDAMVKTYSGGMKRRLEIARGLLHHPTVLFLDEPTVGLDPQTRSSIWQHVLKLRDEYGITVFMTTHYLDEAENCDRIAIIDHGKIQALDTPAGLKRMVGGDVVRLNTTDNERLKGEIAERYRAEVVVIKDGLQLQVTDGSSFVPRIVSDFPGQITSISVHTPTLDDVFLKLTGRAIRDEEGNNAKEQMRQGMRMWRRGGRR